MKKIILIIIGLSFSMIVNAQTSGTLYTADHWADIKGKGGWAEAMDNPNYEKVEILKTDKNIKVTFGTKVYNYAIVSSKKFSEVRMDYTVTLSGKTYVLSIADMRQMGGTYSINIEGVWMVEEIKNVTSK